MPDEAATYSGREQTAQAEQLLPPVRPTPAALASQKEKGRAPCEARPWDFNRSTYRSCRPRDQLQPQPPPQPPQPPPQAGTSTCLQTILRTVTGTSSV